MKRGDLVALTFLDHVESDGPAAAHPIEFEAIGRLVKKTPLYYVVASWIETNGSIDDNTKLFIVLRSTIIKARTLR